MAFINPLYSLAGVLVGTLVGLTGVGGGSLMTPLLVLALGFHPATAIGTDLLYAATTKTVGTIVHGFGKSVDWRVVRRLTLGSAPAAIATLLLLVRAGAGAPSTEHVLTTLLGGALILTAIATLFRDRIVIAYAPFFDAAPERVVVGLTVLLGAVLGVLVSLTSVGAGALGMTMLLLLYPRLPTSRLVGSDIAHAVPLTLIAGIGHSIAGSVDYGLLASLLVGSVPGIILGSLLATRLSDRILRRLLALALVAVGVKLLL